MSKRFVKKTAKGKTYYYLEENGTRSRISEEVYKRSKKLITYHYEKVDGKRTRVRVVKDEELFLDLQREYGVAQVQLHIKNLTENKKSITYKLLKSLLTRSKVERLFSNMGLSPQEVSEIYGIPVGELLDTNRWRKDIFTDSKGRVFEVVFKYNDMNVLNEITGEIKKQY